MEHACILDIGFVISTFLFDAYEISESDGKYAGIKLCGVLFKQFRNDPPLKVVPFLFEQYPIGTPDTHNAAT